MFDEIFKLKKPNFPKLEACGFERTDKGYKICRNIMDGEFRLAVAVSDKGDVDTALTENATGEEYTLYKTGAQGSFVGGVRAQIAAVLSEIAENCFDPAAFKSPQTARFLEFALKTYGDEPEFLWEMTPDCAVLRRKDTRKWYAIIMTVPKNRLGIDSDEKVEIVNMQTKPEDMENLLAQSGVYSGWHMNKKHWYSVILDDSVPDDRLRRLAGISYYIAGAKR